MKMVAANRVVICEAAPNTSESGLVLAGGDKNRKPEMGKVLMIGEGKKPVPFEIGDTIVFRRYTDNRILVGGKEYNFISFSDIMAVIPSKE